MEIYPETKKVMQAVWEDVNTRQQAKLVIFQAIANVSELTAKNTDEILDELDRMLLDEEDAPDNTANKGL